MANPIDASLDHFKYPVDKVLRKVFKFPVLLVQIGGYFPYLLSSKNELYPCRPLIALVVFQLIMHISSVVAFFSFPNVFLKIFGNFYSDTSTILGFNIIGILGQTAIRIALYFKHSSCVQYQNLLNKMFFELINFEKSKSADFSANTQVYYKWIEETEFKMKKFCIVICGTLLLSLAIFFLPGFVILAPVLKSLTVLETLSFTMMIADYCMSMFLFNGVIIWLCCYLSLKQVAFRIIGKLLESDLKYSTIKFTLNKIQTLEKLFTEFNSFSATFLIAWLVFVVITMVHHFQSNLMFLLSYQTNHTVMASVPTIFIGGLTLYFVCTIASDVTYLVIYYVTKLPKQ